jgi:hypothetical protein
MSSNATVNHLKQVGANLYASTSVGLFKSVDNGSNWTAVTSANYATYALAESNGNLVINCTFGIRYSTNNGTTWNDATGDPASITAGDLMAFDGKVYALVASGGGCFISMDQGMTWAAFNGGFGAADAISQDELYTDGNTLYCLAILDIYSIDAIGQGVRGIAVDRMTISPNPSTDGCWINLSNTVRDGDLTVVDQQGRIVHQARITTFPAWIRTDGLAPGLYSIRLVNTATGSRTSEPLIIQ